MVICDIVTDTVSQYAREMASKKRHLQPRRVCFIPSGQKIVQVLLEKDVDINVFGGQFSTVIQAASFRMQLRHCAYTPD